MAGYLALHLRIDAGGASPFDGSHRTAHVTPVALGATSPHGAHEDMFLAGFAVEDFVCRAARADAWQPGAIHVAPDEAAGDYLALRAAELESSKLGLAFDRGRLSAFETRHSVAPISMLPSAVAIDEVGLRDFASWRAARRDVLAYMVFSVDLVTDAGEWPRCLRWLIANPGRLQPAGVPLLLVRAGPMRARPERLEIMIHTTAPAWFAGGAGLGAAISEAAADENLARLGALCARFAAHPGLVEATMATEGREFNAQERRLRSALETAIGRTLPAAF
jgi:hypothetical protein